MQAILFETFDIGPEASESTAEDTCAERLRNVLDDEGLTIHEQVGGKLAANVKGKTIFDRLLALEQDLSAYKQELSAHQQAISALQVTVSDQDEEILEIQGTLAIHEARTATKGYNKIRNQFMSLIQRGPSYFTEKDQKIIGEGNQAAHGGDALYDFMLFQSQARSDFETFGKAYGISYNDFPKIRRFT